jgi:hypothetical protein
MNENEENSPTKEKLLRFEIIEENISVLISFLRDEEAEKLEKESLYVNAYQRDNVSCMTRIF